MENATALFGVFLEGPPIFYDVFAMAYASSCALPECDKLASHKGSPTCCSNPHFSTVVIPGYWLTTTITVDGELLGYSPKGVPFYINIGSPLNSSNLVQKYCKSVSFLQIYLI